MRPYRTKNLISTVLPPETFIATGNEHLEGKEGKYVFAGNNGDIANYIFEYKGNVTRASDATLRGFKIIKKNMKFDYKNKFVSKEDFTYLTYRGQVGMIYFSRLSPEVQALLLEPASIRRTSSREARIRRTSSREASIRRTSSREARIRRTNSREARIRRTSSREASIRRTSSREARIRRTSSRKASIRRTSSREASIKRISSREASIRRTTI